MKNMLKSRYYIGYYNDIALCSSTKKKAVKSYLQDNRKLSPDQYDIIESYRSKEGYQDIMKWYDSLKVIFQNE